MKNQKGNNLRKKEGRNGEMPRKKGVGQELNFQQKSKKK